MLSRRAAFRCGAIRFSIVSSSCRTAQRHYTPILQPEARVRPFERLHSREEAQTLWRRDVPVSSLEEGVQWWLRFGNNPVLHTALPRRPVRFSTRDSSSPFAYVEDYLGTNLHAEDEESRRESLRFWIHYFERRSASCLRLARRTASHHVGVLSAMGETIHDEADQPQTPWERDTYFKEMLYLSERHLKRRAGNLLQLEKAVWFEVSDPEALLQFFDSLQQQPLAHVPVPVPSLWYYEGEERRKWAEKFLPTCQESLAFFQNVLATAAFTAESEAQAMRRLSDQLAKIHEVLLRRHARQTAAGVCPLSPDAHTPTPPSAAVLQWCESEMERLQRSVEEGVLDPEDLLDDSAEWKEENRLMESIASEELDLAPGCRCSYQTFWKNTIRRDMLETLHVLSDDGLRRLGARARQLVFQEQAFVSVLQHLEISLQRGKLDCRAAVFRPYINATWCKWHFAKFGGSSIVQRTRAVSRRLLYAYAASAEEVAANATLYYASKPLSSSVDYSTPFTYRQSITSLCGTYHTEMMRAIQRPVSTSTAHLADAEDAIAAVCAAAAQPFGVLRRRYDAKSRSIAVGGARLVSPVEAVQVHEVLSELFNAGDSECSDESVLKDCGPRTGDVATRWPMGGRRAVKYHWETPALERLRLTRQAGLMTADRMAEMQRLRLSVRLEISLWRQWTAEEREKVVAMRQQTSSRAADLLQSSPALREIHRYATDLFARFHGRFSREEGQPELGEPADEEDGWSFVAMLDDRVALNESQTAEVQIPLLLPGSEDPQATPVPLTEGKYRLRVRAYNLQCGDGADKSTHPGLCSEAFSEPFDVYDAVTGVLEKFIRSEGIQVIPKGSWMTCCRALQEAGVEVPLECQVEAGQVLTTTGDIPVTRFLSLLAQSSAVQRLTEAERTVELRCKAHWQVMHPGGSEAEWAAARCDVLSRALRLERDWWWPDPLLRDSVPLSALSVVPGAKESINFVNGASVHRYGLELCSLLTAEGSSHPRDPLPLLAYYAQERSTSASCTPALRSTCRVSGTGEIRHLSLQPTGGNAGADTVTLDEALKVALEAVKAAQDAHATRTVFKIGPSEKEMQVSMFCDVDALPMGGKYARTYCYAVERAKSDIAAERDVSGRRLHGLEDEEQQRRSEGEQVDRFASATHPEQRFTRFAPRVTLSDENMEDPTPDQESTWGR